jgi:hypothetical protein
MRSQPLRPILHGCPASKVARAPAGALPPSRIERAGVVYHRVASTRRSGLRAIAQLLVGKPAGVAVQEFNDLSATMSEVLAGLLGRVARNMPVDDVDLVTTWTARNDAGGFVLIGDPAVRLRVNDLV